MQEIMTNPNFEFLRPLVTSWLQKLESARQSRKHWQELADECMMFYNKSAAAMWDDNYTRKFWKGVKAPKFRITINKAFELVAVFAPNLLWEVPHRNVESKQGWELPPDLSQSMPQLEPLLQQFGPMQAAKQASDKVVATLMQEWLNYTPREQPGGLMGHSEKAVIDALIKGRGVMVSRPYQFPGSQRTITGSFRIPPEDLLTDPDFKTIEEAKWISIKHIDPHWAVERRFGLPEGSLKDRSTLESTWHYSELQTSPDGSSHRAAGMTNDLIVWYEIYSKTGVGSRAVGMESALRDHLESTVGDYAYLCVSPNVPYPLNCPTQKLRGGMTDAEVKQSFAWPIELWKDERWPVQCLDFYPDPDGAWPIPPLAPAMGELKFLNFMVPWLANRIHSSSKDFWAVAGPHVDHYTKYLQEGGDQTILPTPVGTDDVKKVISVLQQPETRMDAWRIVEMVSELFDKRTGLTEFAYGRNEDGTQNRTAEETQAKARAVGVRPEHMQKKVVAWQSEMATVEAMLTRFLVTGQDVEPRVGPLGRILWEMLVSSSDVELVTRQMSYTVAASSIRRPDRDRDVANFQQVMGLWLPVVQGYGQMTGNFQPINYLMAKWGEYHDTDLSGAYIPPPPPPDPQQMQMQQQQMELEMAKIEAELQGKQLDIQAKLIDGQIKQEMGQAQVGKVQQDLQFDAAKSAQDLQFDAAASAQDIKQDQTQHLLDILQDRQQFNLDYEQTKKMGELKLQLAKAQAAQQQRAKQQAAKAQTNGASKK